MQHPIKIRGRFATVHDTAETLGVSASRTQELIEAVRKFAHGTLQYGSNKKKAGSPTTAVRMKKNSRRHAEATKKKSHTRQTKAHR